MEVMMSMLPSVSFSTTGIGCGRKWKGQVNMTVRTEMNVSGVRMTRTGVSETQLPSGNVRLSLLLALSSQATSQSSRFLQGVATEVAKYLNSRKGEPRNLEEALMTVPDLETIPSTALRKEEKYEIRKLESYLVAETEMSGRSAFDFMGSGQAFNTLAAYLFGKNTKKAEMEMTTPVVVQKGASQGTKMDMTTPVLSQKSVGKSTWRMAFLLPSKYSESELPVPQDANVKIRRVPSRTVAVIAFSGYVTDELAMQKEEELKTALAQDKEVRAVKSAKLEVAQYNPPFTPPFLRRNEILLEVELIRSMSNGGL